MFKQKQIEQVGSKLSSLLLQGQPAHTSTTCRQLAGAVAALVQRLIEEER